MPAVVICLRTKYTEESMIGPFIHFVPTIFEHF